MKEQKTQPTTSEHRPTEGTATERNAEQDARLRARNWESYSPDILAELLDP